MASADSHAHRASDGLSVRAPPAEPPVLGPGDRINSQPAGYGAYWRRSVAAASAHAGAAGATVGAGAFAAARAAWALYKKGGVDKDAGKAVLKSAAAGAVAGGAVALLAENAKAMDLAACTVFTAFSMLLCEDRSCVLAEAVKGASSTATRVTATKLCTESGVFGPSGVVLCPLAAWAATSYVNQLTEAIVRP